VRPQNTPIYPVVILSVDPIDNLQPLDRIWFSASSLAPLKIPAKVRLIFARLANILVLASRHFSGGFWLQEMAIRSCFSSGAHSRKAIV
jgi:hypothetical protein